MELSYDELRRIYRLEKNTSKLVEVEEGFYDELLSFIQGEKKEYLASLKNFSSPKIRGFSNLKKIVEDVFALREKKLLNRALIASWGSEENDVKMASPEKKTFKELLGVLNGHHEFIEQAFEPEKKKAPEKERVSLKVLREVPAFVGTDMKEYGPFAVDEAVSLPLNVAELLLARKLAEEQR